MAIIGGAATPVKVIQDEDLKQNGGTFTVLGRVAIPVHGEELGGSAIIGGTAIYVYPVTDEQIQDGTYSIYGGKSKRMIDVDAAGLARRMVASRQAIPVYVISGQALGSSETPMTYLLRDEFTTDLAAGNVDGTLAEPGPGTRDASALNYISSGKLFSGLGYGDHKHMFDESISRVAGRILLGSMARTQNNGNRVALSYGGAGLGSYCGFRVVHQGTNCTLIRNGGNWAFTSLQPSGFTYSGVTVSDFAVFAIRSTGVYVFVKPSGGNWTLLWIDDGDDLDPLYFGTNPSATDGAQSYDYLRVPDALWLPAPVVSDGFADSNGTSLDAHSTDGAGHAEGVAGGLGTGGSGLSWTELIGDWDIQSNKANENAVSQSTAVVDSGDSDVIVGVTVTTAAANWSPGIAVRATDADNYWVYRASTDLKLYEKNGGSFTERAGTSKSMSGATDYDILVVAYGQTIDVYIDGGSKITYGSASHNETATKHGISSPGTADDRWDNFTIYPRGTGGEYDEALDVY